MLNCGESFVFLEEMGYISIDFRKREYLKLKLISHYTLTILFLASFGSSSFSQVQFTIPLTFIDSLNRTETIWFGVHPNATYCIDDSLGEYELPTDRCWGDVLDAAFFDVRSGSGACMGLGIRIDLRPYTNVSQTDTYKVSWCGRYPITLRWLSNLNLYYDSARITDLFGGIIYNVNMLTQDSLVVTQPLIYDLYIRTWGPKGPTSVSPEDKNIPAKFSLSQNYPNPFNPATTIRYELPKESYVTLKIFDVLGRNVVTLVDERKPAGQYEVEWAPNNIPSSIYFYQLRTSNFFDSKKMLFVK